MRHALRRLGALTALTLGLTAVGCEKPLPKVEADPAKALAAARVESSRIRSGAPGRPAEDTVASVTNVIDGGTLQSGFLVGKAMAPDGIDRVEVSFDGGPAIVADGALNWSVPVPTVASGWRLGTRHAVRLRAVNARGFASRDVALSVVRGRNLDLNGDGFADVAIGAPRSSAEGTAEAGSVGIVYGTAQGLLAMTSTAVDIGNQINGETVSDAFGTALALGDIDGDGYADLVVGAPGRGTVFVFAGRAAGLPHGAASSVAAYALKGLPGFGSLLVLGDVNTDGFDDLAVAAVGAGGVSIFHGSEDGFLAMTEADAQQKIVPTSGTVGQILLADMDGDTVEDLVLGNAAASGGDGIVELYTAVSGSGMPRTPTASASGQRGEALGGILAVGDFNGDGHPDIAASTRNGVVVFPRTQTGLLAMAREAQRIGVADGDPVQALAAADFNGDGFADLVLGTRGLDDGGSAYVLSGSADGLSDEAQELRRSGSRPGERFAHRLSATTDVNNDGLVDLLIGVPGYAPSASEARNGRVLVLQASAVSPLTAYDVESGAARTIDGTGGTGEALAK